MSYREQIEDSVLKLAKASAVNIEPLKQCITSTVQSGFVTVSFDFREAQNFLKDGARLTAYQVTNTSEHLGFNVQQQDHAVSWNDGTDNQPVLKITIPDTLESVQAIRGKVREIVSSLAEATQRESAMRIKELTALLPPKEGEEMRVRLAQSMNEALTGKTR